jgi:hypothetical protein
MNEEINWGEAPEGFDLHVKMKSENYLINHSVKNLEDGYYSLPNGWILDASLCHKHGVVTERPFPCLTEEDSTQGQLNNIGNLLHNLSCSMDNEYHQDVLGSMSSELWEMAKLYKQTPEQKLRAKVWDTVAETDIRESEIDSITTDILEKFKLEEK